jgi:zinc transport system permease protein
MGTLGASELWSLFAPSLLAAWVSAMLCGFLGFFVVTRRVAFISAALGQISGLGVSLGFLIGARWGGIGPHEETPLYLDPVLMALVLSTVVSALMGFIFRVRRTTTESAVAFVYLAAAALAIWVLSSPSIVQEAHEVGDLLFGNTVAVRKEHLEELGVVAFLVIAALGVFFKELLFVSFDRETAQTLGLPVNLLDLVLYVSLGLSVTVATRAIGALPVFAFLVLPAGAALIVCSSVRGVVVLSVVGAWLAATAGFYLSVLESWPTGPMMVVCAAAYWPLAGALHLWRKVSAS